MRLKLALPGVDVRKASVKQTVLDSLYPNPKIDTKANPPHAGIIYVNWASDNLTFDTAVTKVIHSFPHNYNYIPSCFATFSFDNGSTIQSGTLPFQYGAIGMIILESDRTNISLKYFSLDGGSPLTAVPPFIMQVRFYVMAERGADP